MLKRSGITILLVGVLLVLGACASTVRFESLGITKGGDPQMLTGKLMKPRGEGPFSAVVMLHGCDGLKDFYTLWANRLRSWGYVTLQVDSFGPRGVSLVCTLERVFLVTPSRRALDAHGAKLFLAELPFVDSNRIAVMGWSHGGITSLHAIKDKSWLPIPGGPFQAGVAFYPRCDLLRDLNAPLLILIGEEDDWTPASLCTRLIPRSRSVYEITLKVYPGTYHSFDHPVRGQWYFEHWVEHNWVEHKLEGRL